MDDPDDPDLLALGHRVREARLEAGLSQSQLAKAMHVTQGVIAQWETGKKKLPLPRLRQIAALTLSEVGELLGENPHEARITLESEEEEEVVKILRALSPSVRKKLVQFIKASRVIRRDVEASGKQELVHSPS